MSTDSKAKYTPGPWKICKKFPHQKFIEVEHGDKHTKGAASLVIARVTCRTTWQEQQEANARLIAAAPELLEALQECVELLEFLSPEVRGGYSPDGAYAKANSAIAKALGGAA